MAGPHTPTQMTPLTADEIELSIMSRIITCGDKALFWARKAMNEASDEAMNRRFTAYADSYYEQAVGLVDLAKELGDEFGAVCHDALVTCLTD